MAALDRGGDGMATGAAAAPAVTASDASSVAGGAAVEIGASSGASGGAGAGGSREEACTTFYVVRHGQSTFNVTRTLQGWTDTELTDLGRRQAADAATAVRSVVEGSGVRVAAVAASDLKRALHTAQRIATELGFKPADVIQHEGLREHNLGIFAGRSWVQARREYPEETARFDAADRDDDTPIPEGESKAAKYARCTAAIEELARRFRGQAVVAVAHGGTIGDLYARAEPDPAMRLRVAVPSVRNCSISVLQVFTDVDPPEWRRVSWNDTSHLPSAEAPAGAARDHA